MPPKNNVIQWMATLRGLLILFVFLSHLSYIPFNRNFLFIIGRVGVVGFFIVSGFLAKESLEKRNCKQYLLNRFLRIYPIYWILLIITYIFKTYTLPVEDNLLSLLYNVTLFEELFGYEKMIGTSWMLSIMIFLYVVLYMNKSLSRSSRSLFYILCIGSVLLSFLRYCFGIAFPTAFCLLSSVGVMGWMYNENGKENIRSMIKYLIIYNFTLIISSCWSYGDKAFLYILSYNIGILTFYLFHTANIIFSPLIKLNNIGFAFFLCAAIPLKLIERHYYSSDWYYVYLVAVLQFISSILIAYILTRYLEKPILSWGRKKEKSLC